MSEPSLSAPRPVAVATVLAIMACFAFFLVLVYFAYLPHRSPAPQFAAAENQPAEGSWEATPEGRRANLAELRASQEKQAGSYAWIDRKAGVVQLPIDRAMELVAREANQSK